MMNNLNRTPCAADRIQAGEYNLSETALACIAEMIGANNLKIIEEQQKKSPDKKKLDALEQLSQKFHDERQQIYMGNQEVQKRCIEEYGSIIRRKYA